MDFIPDEMAISDARANLTDVVNAVHLQDRAVTLHRRGKRQAVLLPPDLAELIGSAGGLDSARASLDSTRASLEMKRAWDELAHYLEAAVKAGQPIDAADALDYMRALGERYGLPSKKAGDPT